MKKKKKLEHYKQHTYICFIVNGNVSGVQTASPANHQNCPKFNCKYLCINVSQRNGFFNVIGNLSKLYRVQQLPQNYHTQSHTYAKILPYMKCMDKYQKAYVRHHTFYLVIFLTIFPKLVLI